jgi:tetraacyldisaccharide 4'-kinase
VPFEAAPYIGSAPVLFARHRPVELVSHGGRAHPLSIAAGRRVCCFSGLANPASFEALVRSLGARVETAYRFIDHHAYSPGDVADMTAAAMPNTLFITSEKDWVKTADLFAGSADLLALRIAMEIDSVDVIFDTLAAGADVPG